MFSERLKSIALYPALDRFLAGFFLMIVSIVIGYFTAIWAISATRPASNDIYGPWKLQTLGGKTVDTPYSEARLAREGPFVLPPKEIAVFVATADTDNRRLRGECDYRISGVPLDSRWWTLTAYQVDGQILDIPGTNHTLTREDLTPVSDDSMISDGIIVEPLEPTDLVVHVTHKTRYDRWLAVKQNEDFHLVLRLFGAGEDLLSGADDNAMPKIVLDECL